jgi:SAM-dependent methyltransferase
MPNPFATQSMAEGYARARPPLHARIVDRTLLRLSARVPVGLDIGCGSGLSTRPLHRFADRVFGIDPNSEMLIRARSLAPSAHFAAARAEALPFPARSIDLATAAGSLNYSDPVAALREAARVLTPSGAICIYDFAQGRTFRSTPGLVEWFAKFERRYPMPESEAIPLDPEILAALPAGLRVTASERFELATPMDTAAYAGYLMTESNIAAAIRNGAVETEIRQWLQDSLEPVFGGDAHEVVFPGYIVQMQT